MNECDQLDVGGAFFFSPKEYSGDIYVTWVRDLYYFRPRASK